jgi:hypothetical protein
VCHTPCVTVLFQAPAHELGHLSVIFDYKNSHLLNSSNVSPLTEKNLKIDRDVPAEPLHVNFRFQYQDKGGRRKMMKANLVSRLL